LTLHNGFVCLQNSIANDDDDAPVNGELIDDNQCDESSMGENPTSSTSQSGSKSGVADEEFVNKNPSQDETNRLPSITISQRVYGGAEDSDKTTNDNVDNDNDKDDDTPNDIYNFEFSEDQKQAIQELFNLKLDLGFTEG